MKSDNLMIQKQLAHRTIREFKDERIPEVLFNQLMEVARRTPTSNGMQSSSIIRVTDPQKKIKKLPLYASRNMWQGLPNF